MVNNLVSLQQSGSILKTEIKKQQQKNLCTILLIKISCRSTVNPQLPELCIKHADNQTGIMLRHLGVWLNLFNLNRAQLHLHSAASTAIMSPWSSLMSPATTQNISSNSDRPELLICQTSSRVHPLQSGNKEHDVDNRDSFSMNQPQIYRHLKWVLCQHDARLCAGFREDSSIWCCISWIRRANQVRLASSTQCSQASKTAEKHSAETSTVQQSSEHLTFDSVRAMLDLDWSTQNQYPYPPSTHRSQNITYAFL